MQQRLRFTKSARKHLAGRAHALYVINNYTPSMVPVEAGEDPKILWIGEDDRGKELEVLGVDLGDTLLIIHAMPTHYRSS